MKALIALLTLSFSTLALAHERPQAKIAPEFQNMKSLLGTWEGVNKMNGKEEPVKVTYELTSGGTAIVEKLMPGTPMEMTTVYSTNGKTVNATHYCAAGNQPVMTLKNAKANTYAFEMVGNQGITDKNEMHMHAVNLTVDGNKLKQEWTNYTNGKRAETLTLNMTKKM